MGQEIGATLGEVLAHVRGEVDLHCRIVLTVINRDPEAIVQVLSE